MPFALLSFFTSLFYTTDKGDLIRIGYIYDEYPNYRDRFEKDYQREKFFTDISEDIACKNYDIFVIGDSFSNQGVVSYQNYLAEQSGKSILNFNLYPDLAPVQKLSILLNDGFFNEYEFKTVILQTVERQFVSNILKSDFSISSFDQIKAKINKESLAENEDPFLSSKILKFPSYSLIRSLYPDTLLSQVFSMKLKSQYFSVNDNFAYFYYKDRDMIPYNNDKDNIHEANQILNDLNRKLKNVGSDLVVIASPDKYDFYFDCLVDKNGLINPDFYDLLSKEKRNYFYIDFSKFKKSDLEFKDFYYFDDSHWSPMGNKIVSEHIFELL